MITKKFITGLLAATIFVGVPSIAFGQDFDDDIYYNPSKEKKTTPAKTTKKTIKYVPTPDYPAADTYSQPAISVGTVDDKALDAYNRRGMFAVADTADAIAVPLDSLGEFEYTRRIEQFHNPDVVTNTGDQDLIEYYYNQGLQDGLQANNSAVNIYLNSYDPFWYPYNYYGYYRPYYRSWYYNNWAWGPSWNWGWYDPYWGPSWGWGPSWAWGPSWSWGWGPGWGGYYPPVIVGPQYTYRPTGVGSSRPHHATTGAGSTMGRRPGSGISTGTVANGSFSRPGNMGRGRDNVGTGSANTGSSGNRYTTPVQNTQNSSSQSRPGNMGRGRSNSSSSSSQSNSSWSNSSRGSYSSGSSFGGGRSSGGNYGGGSSGGGRGRGR